MSSTEVLSLIFILIFLCWMLGEVCFIGFMGLIGFALWSERGRQVEDASDHPGEPLLRLHHLSSRDGSMWYSGLYTAGVYPDGLYVSTASLFGLFKYRGIFVPWEDLFVSRKWTIFGQDVELLFGNMNLIVPGYVADKLANVAKHRWPEDGTFPVVTAWAIAGHAMRTWAIITMIGGIFFSFFFTILSYLGSGPPIWFAFALPGLFFGIILLVLFARDAREFHKAQPS
jgi:hypothetical protein